MENNNTQFTMSAFDVVQGMLNDTKYTNYNLTLAKEIGLNEGILLSKLIKLEGHWKSKGLLDSEGMFFRTIEDIFEETALTKRQQSTAIKNLKDLGLIETKSKGLPARRYFLLNNDEIAKIGIAVNKKLQNVTSDTYAVSKTQEPQEPHNGGKLQNVTTRSDKREQLEVTECHSILELKELELKVLEEEEEEEERGSELFEFLISIDTDREDAQKLEYHILKNEITGYTFDQVKRAIKISLEDLEAGNCFEPYSWAAGKLERIMKKDKAAEKAKPKQKPRKHTREESVPEWHNKPEQEDEPEETAQEKKETDEKRKALLAKLEKMRKEEKK